MIYDNVSAYKFVDLFEADLPELKSSLLSKAVELQLKGTILLSTEGINLFVAGLPDSVQDFLSFLASDCRFSDLPAKLSQSTEQPFTRMLVRIKKEIISMGREEVKPAQHTAEHLSAQELKKWYEEGRDMLILDTRNNYEVDLGTFKDAVDLNIDTFRAFPDAVKELPDAYKKKPVVTFCTGGIRCEKAAEYMLQQGYEEVYQLDGGILKYFEECGGRHYQGECFVFDKRVSVDADLKETAVTQCYACRMPLTIEQQSDTGACPHCGDNALTGIKANQVKDENATHTL